MPYKQTWWTDEDHARLVGLAAEGHSMTQAAKAIGRSRMAIAGRAHRFGIQFKGIVKPGPRGPRKPKSEQETARVIQFPKPPKAQPAARVVAKPSSPPKPQLKVVTHNIDLMVQDYLARHGARRFESGFSTDYFNIKNFLVPHGIDLKMISSAIYMSRGRGRPRKCTWDEVYGIVDQIRAVEGLTPILRRSA